MMDGLMTTDMMKPFGFCCSKSVSYFFMFCLCVFDDDVCEKRILVDERVGKLLHDDERM